VKLLNFVTFFAFAWTMPASAALLSGQTVQSTYLFPNTATVLFGPTNAVVGAGVELSGFAGFANIDFSDTNILITTIRDAGVNNVAFDGFRFFDVNGLIPDITSVTLNPATNYAGFTSSRLTFDANNVFVNVANLPGLNGQKISIDLNTSASVPEPGTFAMIAAALAVAARRRLCKG
jgi:hypothetical protein